MLTERNIRALVELLEEELDGAAREERERLGMIEVELREIRFMLDRIWCVIETTDLDYADAPERIRGHKRRREQLELATTETRTALAARRRVLKLGRHRR